MKPELLELCGKFDIIKECVTVNGVEVWLRSPPSIVKDRWDRSHSEQDDSQRTENFRAKVVSLCLCDKDGQPLADETPDGWNECSLVLGERWPASVIGKLFHVAVKLAAIGDESTEAAEKNS
jgi:hypothetical protein